MNPDQWDGTVQKFLVELSQQEYGSPLLADVVLDAYNAKYKREV